MQKHRTKQGNSLWRNANGCLPESARAAVLGLHESICTGTDFPSTYLRSQYLSKYCDEGLVPAVTRKRNAIEKWKDQETVNKQTNIRISSIINGSGYNILPRVTDKAFYARCRHLISTILGPLRDSIVLGSFSGGASTSRRRTESSPARKFYGMADVTEAAIPFIDIIYRESDMLRQYNTFSHYREVEGAILFTVPKKTDIDRCACKEPDINMYLQKGVGRHIRKRLRRFGVNLNDQSINRRLAQRGSLLGDLATMDLSSASDSITIECVKALLPPDWFLYLNDIRSQSVYVDGEYHRTEMFSSMGNGFTFELESLIFYALARTTLYFEGIPGIVSVYGDDVIIPSGGFDSVSWVFSEFGFKVNLEKSFHEGPFRESCGGHYHNGEDVTPFYLKSEPKRLTDLIRIANQLRRWALADPARQYIVSSTYNMWNQLKQFVPSGLWGGCDLAVDTQLVSPDVPNKQLVRLSDARKEPELGAYLFWHNSNWNRTSDPEKGFDPQDTRQACRLRSAKTGTAALKDYFHEELIP